MANVLEFTRLNQKTQKVENVGYCKLIDVDEKAVLNFYGDICQYDYSSYGSAFANDKCPQQVSDFFNQIENDKPVDIHFNSGGGDVFAGIAIASLIKAHEGTTTGYVDGIAASIASVILCACDRVIMNTGAQVMIHKPMTGCWGNAADFAAVIEQLDIAQESIVDIYESKLAEGVTKEKISAAVDRETWITTRNVGDYFNFEIDATSEPMAACASTFYDKYIQTPKNVKNAAAGALHTDKNALKDKILCELCLYGI